MKTAHLNYFQVHKNKKPKKLKYSNKFSYTQKIGIKQFLDFFDELPIKEARKETNENKINNLLGLIELLELIQLTGMTKEIWNKLKKDYPNSIKSLNRNYIIEIDSYFDLNINRRK